MDGEATKGPRNGVHTPSVSTSHFSVDRLQTARPTEWRRRAPARSSCTQSRHCRGREGHHRGLAFSPLAQAPCPQASAPPSAHQLNLNMLRTIGQRCRELWRLYWSPPEATKAPCTIDGMMALKGCDVLVRRWQQVLRDALYPRPLRWGNWSPQGQSWRFARYNSTAHPSTQQRLGAVYAVGRSAALIVVQWLWAICRGGSGGSEGCGGSLR